MIATNAIDKNDEMMKSSESAMKNVLVRTDIEQTKLASVQSTEIVVKKRGRPRKIV